MRLFSAILFVACFVQFACGQEAPAVSKTEFTATALKQPLFALGGQQTTAKSVLEGNKRKTVLLYIWATWCPDCIDGFPALYAFQQANPDVHTVYFSLDREEQQWREGVEKFKLEGEHYWFKTGWKNDFTTAIDLNWIPRYLIISPDGKIARYYSVKADDPALQQAVDALR
ncbi:TlpA family protein disulfide reductase [Parapedobacter deserti]|uniref:TlpA family protein disulfide reductase n=1 Tax=Parapedobacter deserti TaxID=1912957 RepID=A0ABV7JP54_9SPHI